MEIKHDQLWPVVHTRLREYLAGSWNIELVAHVTCSTPQTVTGWLADSVPTGERLIKLWHLLAAVGCQSPELDELSDFNRLCGELLTFGVLTVGELQEMLEVHNVQPVLAMLRGGTPMRRHFSFEELSNSYGATLATARKKALPASQEARKKLSHEPADPRGSTRQIVTSPQALMQVTQDTVLLAASLLGSIGPLARYLDSDDCTPQDRSRLRKLVGNEELFELSNHVNNLCSERARGQGRSGSQ